MDPRLRIVPAVLALAMPAVVFALNGLISVQKRGFFDLSDLIASIGFGVLAYMVWRRSRVAVYAGILLTAIYLVSAVLGGPVQFLAYWIVAFGVLVESLRVIRAPAPAA